MQRSSFPAQLNESDCIWRVLHVMKVPRIEVHTQNATQKLELYAKMKRIKTIDFNTPKTHKTGEMRVIRRNTA